MRIERVIVRGLRAVEARDDAFLRPGGTHGAVCLRGLNGSGKTTYLEGIAQLWEWFRVCTRARGRLNTGGTLFLRETELLAVYLSGLPGPRERMWLAWGQGTALRSFLDEHGDDLTQEVLGWWERAFVRAELGAERIPNVVWIAAENKWVPELAGPELFQETAGPALPAVARYAPHARDPNHLEGILVTLKLVDEERFEALCTSIAELLPGLSLSGFDEATRRPLFRLERSGTLLTVDRLSAGERSVLINLAMVARWLGPGGIVLLDEPELHQHLSLMRGSVAVLETEVARRGGQLIVASHAPEVWDHFRATGVVIDLEGRTEADRR
jgi:predicted ATPase